MKKRAVISTAASIMLAGAMCFGFAACGEGETDVRKKIDALRGEEVTEEVWNAVWNKESDAYRNYKIDFVQTTIEREHDDSGYTTAIQYIHADNKDYTSFDYVPIIGNSPVGNVVTSYHYYDSAIGEYLEKSEETGNEWVVGTEVVEDMLAFYLIDYFASTVIPDLGGYSDFTYSTEEKGYILANCEACLYGESHNRGKSATYRNESGRVLTTPQTDRKMPEICLFIAGYFEVIDNL